MSIQDQSITNLLKEIDDLMNRMEDKQDDKKSDNYQHLKQTGRFLDNQKIENDFSDHNFSIPKKFHTSVPKIKNQTPKKVKIYEDSSSQSSSDDDQYEIKKKKKKYIKPKSIISNKTNQQQLTPIKQQSIIGKGSETKPLSQCSYRSKIKQSLKFDGQSQQSKIQDIPQQKDAFCLICEEFIPIEIVNFHMNECYEKKQPQLDQKLNNLSKLLSLRYEACQDEELKQMIELLHNQTKLIIESTDHYTLCQIIEDLCVIKTQLSQNTKSYHILTVAQKILDIANRKSHNSNYLEQSRTQENQFVQPQNHQQRIQIKQQQQLELEQQTVISYVTNLTTRKKLFDQPQLHQQPKQLISFKKILQKQDETTTLISKQPGIEFGNNFDSSKKREYIQLQNSNHKQQESDKIEKSVVSNIKSYISNISNKLTSQNELQKKNFFNLAVKLKDCYPINHPAQNILISEMYNQCLRQQIPINEWEIWINNILLNA